MKVEYRLGWDDMKASDRRVIEIYGRMGEKRFILPDQASADYYMQQAKVEVDKCLIKICVHYQLSTSQITRRTGNLDLK